MYLIEVRMICKYRFVAIIIEASLHLLCQLPVTYTLRPVESFQFDKAFEESQDRLANTVKCPNYKSGNYTCDSCLPGPGGCYCSVEMLFQCKNCHDICALADVMETSSECNKYCPCYSTKMELAKCSEVQKELYKRLQSASQEIDKLKDELEKARAKNASTTTTEINRMKEDKLKEAIETADNLLKIWIPVALVGSCVITACCVLFLLRRKLGSNDVVRLKAGFGDTCSVGSISSVVDYCPKNVWNSVGNSGGQIPGGFNHYYKKNTNTNNNVAEPLSRTSTSSSSTTDLPVAINNMCPKPLVQNPHLVGLVSASNSRSQSHQLGFDLPPSLIANANVTNQAATQFQHQFIIQNNQPILPRNNQQHQQHQQHQNNQNQSPQLLGVDNWMNNSPLIATSAAYLGAGTFPGKDPSVSPPPPPQSGLHAMTGYGAGGNVDNGNVRLRRSSSCGRMGEIRGVELKDSNNRNNELLLSLPNVDAAGIVNRPVNLSRHNGYDDDIHNRHVNPSRHNFYISSNDDSDINNINNKLYNDLYNNLHCNNHNVDVNVVFRVDENDDDDDDDQVKETEVAILPPSRKAMKKKGKVENDKKDKGAFFELSELKIVQPETGDDVDDEPSTEALTVSTLTEISTSSSAAPEQSSSSLLAVTPASPSISPSAALPASSTTSASAASSTSTLYWTTMGGDDNSNSLGAKARSTPPLETRVLQGDEGH